MMVRVEKVFKEKDYKQTLNPEDFTQNKIPTPTLGEIFDNLNPILAIIKSSPIKTGLTVIALTLFLYITFRAHTKFGKIKSNLKKI